MVRGMALSAHCAVQSRLCVDVKQTPHDLNDMGIEEEEKNTKKVSNIGPFFWAILYYTITNEKMGIEEKKKKYDRLGREGRL